MYFTWSAIGVVLFAILMGAGLHRSKPLRKRIERVGDFAQSFCFLVALTYVMQLLNGVGQSLVFIALVALLGVGVNLLCHAISVLAPSSKDKNATQA